MKDLEQCRREIDEIDQQLIYSWDCPFTLYIFSIIAYRFFNVQPLSCRPHCS